MMSPQRDRGVAMKSGGRYREPAYEQTSWPRHDRRHGAAHLAS